MLNKFNLKKLIIGTANFGQNYGLNNKKIKKKEILKILNYSYKNGVRIIDTAINYGNSEKIIGKLKNKNWKVISKIPNISENIKNINAHLYKLILKTQKNLNTKIVYAILIHNPENLLDKRGKKIYNTLLNFKKIGLINKIGVSIYKFDQITILMNKYNFDIIQLPFNLIDRRLLNKNLLKKLKKNKIEVHTRSIFLKGLLLKDKLPNKFKKWQNIWSKIRVLKKNEKINNLALCLQFIKRYSKIDKIVVGVDSLKQIKEILKELKSKRKLTLPNIQCKDEKLINPNLW